MIRKTLAILAAVLLSLANPARAQHLVYDASNYSQMAAQIQQMAKDYQKQLEQLDEAVRQSQALTGTRAMGSLANGAAEQALRAYLPGNWQDTMHLSVTGDFAESLIASQSLYDDLLDAYEPLPGSEFIAGDPQGPIAGALDRRTATTFAAMTASEQAYNGLQKRVQIYEQLLSELDKTEDLKASVDLLARISVENGLIMNEIMRLSAVAMQQQAASDGEALTSYARAARASRYDAQEASQAFKWAE